jgi:DNA-binding response OmpR family regulator
MKSTKAADILVVEDDSQSGQLVTSALRGEGHTVRWVRSAREAREELRERPPDVLVLDLTLETDGLELLQALRFSAADPRGGIVVLAEARDPRSRERAQQLGAAAVLSKPLKGPEEVTAAVKDLAAWL